MAGGSVSDAAPPVAEQKSAWNHEVPTVDEWPPGNSNKVVQQPVTPTATPQPADVPSLQPPVEPRIVPMSIAHASAKAQQAAHSDAQNPFSDFETDAKKPRADFNVTSSSPAPSATKKPVRQKSATELKASFGGFSDDPFDDAKSDDESPRAKQRPKPAARPVRNDFMTADKKPADKHTSSDSDADWSDVPDWKAQPPATGSSGDSGSGPAIRPGTP
jgi:hypothetical protein